VIVDSPPEENDAQHYRRPLDHETSRLVLAYPMVWIDKFGRNFSKMADRCTWTGVAFLDDIVFVGILGKVAISSVDDHSHYS